MSSLLTDDVVFLATLHLHRVLERWGPPEIPPALQQAVSVTQGAVAMRTREGERYAAAEVL